MVLPLKKFNEVVYFRRLFLQVDGMLNSDDFIRVVTEQQEAGGKFFEKRRWFCGEGELICINSKTYALSNQWGGNWSLAMNLLKDNFPDAKIEFSASKELENE